MPTSPHEVGVTTTTTARYIDRPFAERLLPTGRRLYEMALRQFPRPPELSRSNDAHVESELVQVAVWLEEARLLGEHRAKYVGDRMPGLSPRSVSRRIAEADALLEREPGWWLAVKGRASLGLSGRGF